VLCVPLLVFFYFVLFVPFAARLSPFILFRNRRSIPCFSASLRFSVGRSGFGSSRLTPLHSATLRQVIAFIYSREENKKISKQEMKERSLREIQSNY